MNDDLSGAPVRRVRDAEPGDLPALVELYNSFVTGHFATADTIPLELKDREVWFRSHCPDQNPLWVCEVGGEFAGYISFSFYRGGRPALRGVRELSYFVTPGHQRTGVGRFMIERAIEVGPRLGVRHFICFVMAHNVGSVGLLESVGFERWGLLPGVAEFDGGARDHAIFGRKV